MSSRKRKAFTIAEKLQIVDHIKKGEPQARVSRDIGIAESTIRGWLKDQDKLRQASSTMDDCGQVRKRARLAKDQQLDDAVLTWFLQAQSEGMPISGPVIQSQALKLHKELHGDAGEENFEASNGWLNRFKLRHSISQSTDKFLKMAKKKKLRQAVHDNTAKGDGQPYSSDKLDLKSRNEKGKKSHASPAVTQPTKECSISNQDVREKIGQSSKSAVQRQPTGDKTKIQLQMKKKPVKALQESTDKDSLSMFKKKPVKALPESTDKDSPSVFKKKIRDPKLIPRMREYLESRTKKNIVSIPLMAEYLQNKYPNQYTLHSLEYGSATSIQKSGIVPPFAYNILDKQPLTACSSSSSSDFSDDDADGNDQPIDGKPRVKRQKVLNYNDDVDSVEEEEEVLMEYKDTNSINNMMSSMYKSSSQHAAVNPKTDSNRENSLITGNGNTRNANSDRLGTTKEGSNDCYFIDKKGDNKGKEKSKPHLSASNSRDTTIQKFMGGLPVRSSSVADGSVLKDPRLSAKNLHKRFYNESDSDSQIRGHGGITQNNTGISIEAPSSPTPEDQFGDRIAAPIVIESDREDTSLIMEANTSRGDVDDAVKETETLTPKRSRKQKVASKSKKNKDEKAETGSKEGPALQKSTITFADIGGNEQSLIEICKLLVHMRHPEVYQQLGVTPPRGFLLHGPPGCGKTLLANAIAGELDLPLLKIAATEIVSGVSGDSEEKVRELFEKATQSAPCVLFIDEVDAITPKRETASKDMERRIVSQLLTCMDDLNANVEAHVLVIGATNRPDSLDPALRRAGRFDKEICLGIPDEMSRKRILEVLCRNLRLTKDFDFSYLAKFTPGYVGADLMSLTREAAMVAVNRVFKDLQMSNPAKQTSEIGCHGETIPHAVSSGKEAVMDTSENIETSAIPTISKSISVIRDSDDVKKTNDSVNKAVNQSDGEHSTVNQPRTENRTVNQSKSENSAVNKSDSSTSLLSNNTMDTSCNLQSSIDPAEQLQISESIVDSVVTTSSAGNTSCVQSEGVVMGKDKMQNPESKELALVLSWLKDTPPLTEDQLRNLFVTLEDFKIALKSVQPSAKREGFATVPDVTWDDIGALHDVREELQLAILAPVRHPEEFKALGLNRAQGILLAGPPGCGKTLLAKAVANESGINFISVKGPELLNMYVGESEKAVRTVFQRARNSSPCVIFFDELDALCPRRSSGADGGSSTRVVNQLLTEMDGLEERKQVFIMAATNRPDIIDPAVLRPGRLDKTLYVGLPTLTDRLDILRCLTKNGTQPHLSSDVDMNVIAGDQRCENYTGADIAALVREASVTALKEAISNADRPSGTLIEVASGHFETAFRKIKPSVSEKDRDRYMNMGQKLTTD